MDPTIKIYFEVTWFFTDGRADRPPHIFHVDCFRDALNFENQVRSGPKKEDDHYRLQQALSTAFSEVLQKECPEFNDKEFQLTSLNSNGEKFLLDKHGDLYGGLISLITFNKETAFSSKPIPLRIEQRLCSAAQYPKMDDEKPPADTTTHLSPSCSECHETIEGSLFQCFQCDGDYIICGSCVTSGKHPEHSISIRATDSKVDHDAIADPMAVRSKKDSIKTRKQKSLVHLDEAQMKDMQKYCKNIIRLSSNNIKILSKESSKPENPTDVHVETAPSTSSSVVLKTEDSDAKSPDSSVSSDGLVLENGAIALSPSSHSAVQETPIPIETSNPDRPPDELDFVQSILSMMINRRFGSEEGAQKWLESKLQE